MSGARSAGSTGETAPVVFLDIDDVLCLSSPYGGFDAIAAVNGLHVNPAEVYRNLFANTAKSALERVHVETMGKFRYVISSTWREFSLAQLQVVFRQAGLGFVADNLHDGDRWRTRPKLGRSRRIDEIAQWLDRHHQGEPFAILDDTHSGASLTPALQLASTPPSNVPAMGHSKNGAEHPFAERVVLCDENVGLTDDHVPFILAALRRPMPVARIPA